MQYRLLALLISVPGCIIVTEGNGSDDPPSNTSSVIVTPSCPGEYVTVDSAEVVGDRLVVTASYGGCNSALLWACWDGSFLESSPVQAPIAIHHGESGDCDAVFTGNLSVSLDPVIDGYALSYGYRDTIILRVGDFSPAWQP